jgi:hypothetical protein
VSSRLRIEKGSSRTRCGKAEVKGGEDGMVMSKSGRHGRFLDEIMPKFLSLVFGKVECGEGKVLDKVSIVGEDYGMYKFNFGQEE